MVEAIAQRHQGEQYQSSIRHIDSSEMTCHLYLSYIILQGAYLRGQVRWNEDHTYQDGHTVLLQAQDFDPHSLRSVLPKAVKLIDQELRAGRKVYVHCTAGLGRAPAACIAYLYWFQDFQLENVSLILTSALLQFYATIVALTWLNFKCVPGYAKGELSIDIPAC